MSEADDLQQSIDIVGAGEVILEVKDELIARIEALTIRIEELEAWNHTIKAVIEDINSRS